jgi:3'-phosphoadenosine 5'-phosphosulfate (PAPS) 3'-phosphatase
MLEPNAESFLVGPSCAADIAASIARITDFAIVAAGSHVQQRKKKKRKQDKTRQDKTRQDKTRADRKRVAGVSHTHKHKNTSDDCRTKSAAKHVYFNSSQVKRS